MININKLLPTSETLVSVDHGCDKIPFLSTVTNIVNIFQKCVILPFLSQKTIDKSKYYSHLQKKGLLDCTLLAIPFIGNILGARRQRRYEDLKIFYQQGSYPKQT